MRALALLLVACAAPQKPADDGRLAALEQKLAGQQRELDDLRKLQAVPDDKLAELGDQIRLINAKLDAIVPPTALSPPPPPPRRREPDPNAVYAVRVGDSPTEGPAKAKVTVIVASDYACPYCERVVPTMDELRKKYGDDVRIVHKSFIVHTQQATTAAMAACAAHHQKKWRQVSDLLWSEAFDKRKLDDASIDAIADQAKLDLKRYRADVSGRCQQEVADDQAALQKFGVGAIPAFFINGRFTSGAQPLENFTKIVDEELAKANAAIGKGVKADRYYDVEIVGKGLTELAP